MAGTGGHWQVLLVVVSGEQYKTSLAKSHCSSPSSPKSWTRVSMQSLSMRPTLGSSVYMMEQAMPR